MMNETSLELEKIETEFYKKVTARSFELQSVNT